MADPLKPQIMLLEKHTTREIISIASFRKNSETFRINYR